MAILFLSSSQGWVFCNRSFDFRRWPVECNISELWCSYTTSGVGWGWPRWGSCCLCLVHGVRAICQSRTLDGRHLLVLDTWFDFRGITSVGGFLFSSLTSTPHFHNEFQVLVVALVCVTFCEAWLSSSSNSWDVVVALSTPHSFIDI